MGKEARLVRVRVVVVVVVVAGGGGGGGDVMRRCGGRSMSA